MLTKVVAVIRERTGEIFTRMEFDREEKQAYALEVEARDGAASARPNANGRPNTGNAITSYRLTSWIQYFVQ